MSRIPTLAIVAGLSLVALGTGGWQAADAAVAATSAHCTGLACACSCHAHAIAGVTFGAIQGVLGTMIGLGAAASVLGAMFRLTSPAAEPTLA